jgi:hypothetical protein
MSGSGVMKQNDSSGLYLWQPGFIIMLYLQVSMKSVYMKDTYRTVAEVCKSFVECGAEQTRKRAVVKLVVVINFKKDAVVIPPRMFIAAPRIDGIAAAGYAVFLHGLAKPEIRFSVMCPEFDEQGRPLCRDKIMRERQMAGPCTASVAKVPPRFKPFGWQRNHELLFASLHCIRTVHP